MKVKQIHLKTGEELKSDGGTVLDWERGRGVMVHGNGTLFFPENMIACVVVKEPDNEPRREAPKK